MHVFVTGSSGLVGSKLLSLLNQRGHEVTRIVRSEGGEDCIRWDPKAGTLDPESLEAADAVVHLAGENIAARRWTDALKARIRDSRVQGTKLLCETLARLQNKPHVLVAASAIGYYGDRGEEPCDETASAGQGFLPDVCQQWEAATKPAAEAGIRVVNLRIGIVLSPEGGALSKMLLPFKLGAGGRVGSGKQYWSWIGLDDLVAIIIHCLSSETLHGPVNAVAPLPVTNAEFTKVLGRILKRPTIFPMPAAAARLALGEMADELLLAGANVKCDKLRESGYKFIHPNLDECLRALLSR